MKFKFLVTIFLVNFTPLTIHASESKVVSEADKFILINNSMSCASCSAPSFHLSILNYAIRNNNLELATKLMDAIPPFALVQTRDNKNYTFSAALLAAYSQNRKVKNSINCKLIENLDEIRVKKINNATCCATTMLGHCCYQPHEAIGIVNKALKESPIIETKPSSERQACIDGYIINTELDALPNVENNRRMTQDATSNNTMCCSSCCAPSVHLDMLNHAIANGQLDFALDLMRAVPSFMLGKMEDNNDNSFAQAVQTAKNTHEMCVEQSLKITQLNLFKRQKIADAPSCTTTFLGYCCYRPDEAVRLVNETLKIHNMYFLPTME